MEHHLIRRRPERDVRYFHLMDHPSYSLLQKIQKWFYNHYAHPRRQYHKFTRKWSARNAFYHLHCDEVLELARTESEIEPGHPAFLGALQDATTALWERLSAEDREEYEAAAKEWSSAAPPKYVQSR